MSAHLTHEELTDHLLGISSLTVNAHLLNCQTCANELVQMKNTISDFRGAALAWTENVLTRDHSLSAARSNPKQTWGVNWWVVAFAAMILFVGGLMLYVRDYGTGKPSPVPIATSLNKHDASRAQIEKDNELLSQVYDELGEAVPSPMQPLRLEESPAASRSASK